MSRARPVASLRCVAMTEPAATAPSRPKGWRVGAGLLLVAVLGWLAAQVLGEYEFEGVMPFVAGPLLGLVLAEAAVAVGRWRDLSVAVFCAGVGALSLVWAGRIDSAHGLEPMAPLVWVAAALAAAVAFLRARPVGGG